MSIQTHSQSKDLPINRRKTVLKIHTRSITLDQVKAGKFLLVLVICTWIIAVFVSLAFYITVRCNRPGMDLFAGLLLGMIILGWIMAARYFHAQSKSIPSSKQGDSNNPTNVVR